MLLAVLAIMTPVLRIGVIELRSAHPPVASVPIAGNRSTLPPGAQVLGSLPDTRPLHIVVGLTPRHRDRLAAYLRLRQQRGSAFFGATLTPAQFGARFGATADAEAGVVDYVRAYGLRILHTYPDRLLLDASGSVRQVAAAFGTSLVRYRDPAGLVHYANTTAPRLPSRLAAVVDTVVGLRDDGPTYQPASALRKPGLPLPGGPQPRAIHPPLQQSSRPATADSATGHTDPPAGLITPAQIRTAHDVTPLYSQVFTSGGHNSMATITGAGQTIALFELSPFDPADVRAYDAAFDLPTTMPGTEQVDGGATNAFGVSGQRRRHQCLGAGVDRPAGVGQRHAPSGN